MVWRIVLLSSLLSNLALAQPPSETCKERCTKAIMECLNPCANASSKNSEANLNCVRACRQKHQPCLQTCEKGQTKPGN